MMGAKLVAAPGGCRQRNINIRRIEAPTAVAAAVDMSVIFNAHAMPTTADINCPPTKGQGWAKGLPGIKNKIMADAPIEAIIIGLSIQGEVTRVIRAIKKIEQKQASSEIVLALVLKLTGSTVKHLSPLNKFITKKL